MRFLFLLFVCSFASVSWAQGVDATLETVPLDDLSAFLPVAGNWEIAGDVRADRNETHALEVRPGRGVLVNRPTEEARDNLFTDWEHGDLSLVMDVMMPRGSNSGIYLQGRYEVQLFDSWGVDDPSFSDMGGIYQRWDPARGEGREGYRGVAPRLNAARAPGLWQHLEIDFRAPRFDAQGRKVQNARFERVALNGVVLHENLEVTGPTRAAAFDDERPTGPLMIQGDHGPVAFREIRYKRFGNEPIRLTGVHYRAYEGAFDGIPDVDALTPAGHGTAEGILHDVVPDEDAYALAHEGTLHVPTTGDYRFVMELWWVDGDPHAQGRAIGGGELRVDDEVVLRHEGRERVMEGSVRLEAGAHPFELVTYKNYWGSPVVSLAAEGPDTRPTLLNAPGTLPAPSPVDPIYPEPGGEPVVLRGMVPFGEGKRTHGVSVGDPEGVHYALDLARGALLYAWKGPFVDATPMWHSRGYSQLTLPRGSTVTFDGAPALARLARPSAAWPDSVDAGVYRLGGYVLDAAGRPTFTYRFGELDVMEYLAPVDAGRALHRLVEVHAGVGGGDDAGLWHRLAAGTRIERLGDGSYLVDGDYYVAPDAGLSPEPVVRATARGQELVVPVRLAGGEARVGYTLIW